jgi:hypothetical protein
VLFTSEYLLPGGSNLAQGDIVQGGIHVGLGFLARAVFGLPGLLLVSANSFTKAVTGRHLHEHLGLGPSSDQATTRSSNRSKADK